MTGEYCPHCIYYGEDCHPDEEDFDKECSSFEPVGYDEMDRRDKARAMELGLWDIEDEINDMGEPDEDS